MHWYYLWLLKVNGIVKLFIDADITNRTYNKKIQCDD